MDTQKRGNVLALCFVYSFFDRAKHARMSDDCEFCLKLFSHYFHKAIIIFISSFKTIDFECVFRLAFIKT